MLSKQIEQFVELIDAVGDVSTMCSLVTKAMNEGATSLATEVWNREHEKQQQQTPQKVKKQPLEQKSHHDRSKIMFWFRVVYMKTKLPRLLKDIRPH